MAVATEAEAEKQQAAKTGTDGKPLGIVHRDVSFKNVLIAFEGDVNAPLTCHGGNPPAGGDAALVGEAAQHQPSLGLPGFCGHAHALLPDCDEGDYARHEPPCVAEEIHSGMGRGAHKREGEGMCGGRVPADD
jgi:hypothetical protein